MAISVVFFRTIDTLLNLMIAFVRCGGKCLRKVGITSISRRAVSSDAIRANLNAVKKSSISEPFLLFKLLLSPRRYLFPKPNSEPVSPSDKNWGLNQHFGHIYVINLNDTPNSQGKFGKRLERIKSDLEQIGCNKFERLPATHGATELDQTVWNRMDDNSFHLDPGIQLDRQHQGQAGCYMSHYRAIQDAFQKHQEAVAQLNTAQNETERARARDKVKEYDSILILEDDNGFGHINKPPIGPATVSLAGTGNHFRQVMNELPRNWDMLHLVAVECRSKGVWNKFFGRPTDHSPHLNRLNYGLLANAVAIHSRAYPTILKALSKIDDPKQTFRPLDHEYGLLHSKLNAFTPKKPLAYQAPCVSAITEGLMAEPWDGTWERGF